MERGDFVHELLVYHEASGGVDYDYAVAFFLRLCDGVSGHFYGVLLSVFGEHRHPDLLPESAQLVYRGGTEGVARGEHDLHSLFALEVERELAAECGLSGTVESGDEHYGGRAFDIDFRMLGAHELGEFVVDYLDHHLLGLDRCEHVGSHGLVLDAVAEGLGHLV